MQFPGAPLSPFFITFDGLWTPFGAWSQSPNFGPFNEMGLPIVDAESDAMDPFETDIESGAMEESTYDQLTNLLDNMFTEEMESESDTEIAEVETDSDEIDQ